MPLLKQIPSPKEPTFEIDSFDQPLEVSGADAWVRDVIAAAFFEQGTFSDDPEFGVEINKEMFAEIDVAIASVNRKLQDACEGYLSNIPISDLSVSAYFWNETGTYVMVLNVVFDTDEGPTTFAAYVTTIDTQLSYIISKL